LRFEVTILGSNSAIPAHGRNQTSQLVNIGNSSLLLDCGESTQIQLRKYKLKYSQIDFIFISHLHGDHFYGLMGLISTFHLYKRPRLLTIFGPTGLDEIITIHLKHSNTRLHFPLRFVPTNPNEKELILEEKQFRVYTLPMEHRIACTGFLIQEKHGFLSLIKEKIEGKKLPVEAIQSLRKGVDVKGEGGKVIYSVSEFTHPAPPIRSYAFCSDTRYNPELAVHFQGTDLLYHEATFTEIETNRAAETYHSTAKQAGLMAQKSGAKKLLLGHFSTRYIDLSPIVKEAIEVFPHSYLAVEGQTYEV
jgi:ribonuclease Z